ncbi:hypothetical protein E3C22_06105 [Jiella endophytica]|uniref:Spy/CpxP family protein refolding chaperone n=1 Tax=Jiella endophytica TaxID=2558362 RepID=A0A4Y8RPG4_9HYPH|nr:hypothetical protein [Jiella endophytica]TFF24955.1 hypothetical protein E3C22_06105 [Jiella endophytica]
MRPVRDMKTPAAKAGRFGRRAGMTTGAILAAALVGTSAFAQTMPQAGSQQTQQIRQGDDQKGPMQKGPMRLADRFDRGGPEGDGWRKGRDHRGPGHHGGGRHGPRHGMMMSPARLAGALAAIETGIGIQPDQMATWRKFTAALIDFAESMQPPMGPHGMRPHGMGPARPGGPDAAAPQPGDDNAPEATDQAGRPDAADQKGLFAFRMLDRFADRAIDAGEKAKTLKSALADLETTLTPDQVKTARGLVRSMMQDMRRGDRGPRHHMGPGPGHGPRFGERHGGPRGPMPPQDDMGGPSNGGPADMAPDEGPDDGQDEAPQQG